MKDFALKILLPFCCLLAAWWLVYASPFQHREAPEPSAETATAPSETADDRKPLPDSVLFYGELTEIRTDAQGRPIKLRMDSPQEEIRDMNLEEETVFVDSGNFCAFDPSTLTVGDRLYIFHSPISARTMPPQSPALAVIRNIPMDAVCGMYRRVDAVETEEDNLIVTTNLSPVKISAGTPLFAYDGGTPALSDILEGSHIILWYSQTQPDTADAVMVLPPETERVQ